MAKPLSELDAAARLALAAHVETVPVLASKLHVPPARLLDMIECKVPLCRRVVRYLGLRREISYRHVSGG